MQKPHIVFLSAPFSGIEVSFRKMQGLVERRDDLRSSWIYVEWDPAEFSRTSAMVLRNWTLKASEVARRRVNRLMADGSRIDAIVSNSIVPMLFLRRRAPGIPIILSLDATPRLLGTMAAHYDKTEPRAQALRIWLDRELVAGGLYRKAARLYPWSEFARESLVRDYRVRPDRAEVLPPGIDLVEWPRPEPPGGATRSEGPVKLLFVGGDFERKGGDLVLRLSRLPEFRNCEFHLVTRRFLGEKGENVHVHEGLAADSRKLRGLFSSSDLFLMPTRADFAPTMAVCEALASGLPVVTSRIGGMDTVIAHGENGFVAGVGAFEELARHTRELVENTGLRHRMAAAARGTAEQKFDLEHNARYLVDSVLQACGKLQSSGVAETARVSDG